jgi:hypothetical protein
MTVSGYIKVTKLDNYKKIYNSIKFVQNYRSIRLYCTSRLYENNIEILIAAVNSIFNFDISFCEVGFVNDSFPKYCQINLQEIIKTKQTIPLKDSCLDYLRKSEKFRKYALLVLDNYFFVNLGKKPILIDNCFVICRNLLSVRTFLETSKLKVYTLKLFCQSMMNNREVTPKPYKELSQYF